MDFQSLLSTRQLGLSGRFVAFHANTSARDPTELDGSEELLTEDPEVLARLMMNAHRLCGVPLLGGCCGTATAHIASLAAAAGRYRDGLPAGK